LFYYCSGKIECVLFGEYVSLFQELIAKNSGKFPVVVIQFGKVKLFRGFFIFFYFITFVHLLFCFKKFLNLVFSICFFIVDKVSIQNYDSATRFYFDPPSQYVDAFKNRLV
jgi:hypothetical protein